MSGIFLLAIAVVWVGILVALAWSIGKRVRYPFGPLLGMLLFFEGLELGGLFGIGRLHGLGSGESRGIASLLGLWGSYIMDLPTGAAIVCASGLLLAIVGASGAVRRRA